MQENPATSFKVVHAINPQSASSVQTSVSIDCQGFSKALVILMVGAITTGGVINAEIEDCATTDGSFADLTTPDFVAIADTGGSKSYIAEVDLKACKRFIHVEVTPSVQASLIAVVVILSGAKYMPITQTATTETVVV